MSSRLSEALRIRALAEATASMKRDHTDGEVDSRRVEEKLTERIDAVVKSIGRFEEAMKKAEVTVYIDLLRSGHRKDLLAILTKGGGGVKKETAKLIVDELDR